MSTILWQRLEGALVFIAMLVVLISMDATSVLGPIWVLVLLFFAPDLSFAGYLGGPRLGAAVYNLVHLYGFGLALIGIGFLIGLSVQLVILGMLWTAHAGFDRMLGYGLKELTAFTDTHLGRIGKG